MTTAETREPSSGLRGFRRLQRLAYKCAEAVAARLEPGVTEREAARMQREWLRGRGVRPRLGFRGTGAKFKDILVVTDSQEPGESAFRLVDDLPRMPRRAEAKAEGK